MAIGCELVQIQGAAERVIAYGSFALSPEQTRYCTTRKELLAVVRFARQYRHYLLGKRVLVRTDHNSLTWLLNFKEPQGQLARWIEELSQYDLEIQYRKGSKHANADALSRIPQPGTCKYYKHGQFWKVYHVGDVKNALGLMRIGLSSRPMLMTSYL